MSWTTYAFKLSRRLAVARTWATAAAAPVLVAGCGAGDGTTDPNRDEVRPPGAAIVEVSPGSVSLAPNQHHRFTAAVRGALGSSPALVWSATGGQIDSAGNYSAGAVPGDYRVVATAADGGVADTAIVTIISSADAEPGALVLTPDSATVSVGGTVQFGASTMVNGQMMPAPVTFSASGGIIAVDGLFTAGSAAGSFRVVATAPDGRADTAVVVVTAPTSPPASGGGREPAGYVAFAEHQGDVLPGGTRGRWAVSSGSNLSIRSISGAPQSPSSVIRTRFPAGLPGGTGPVNWSGWDAGGYNVMKKKLYISFWVRVVGPDFENHAVLTKMGFIGYGESTSRARNQGFFTLEGTGTQGVASSWIVKFRQQNHVSRNLSPNVNRSKVMTAGRWHRWEAVLELNTLGRANGIFKMWIDGVQIMDYRDVVYITSGNTNGFHGWKWNPTWGGAGGTKTRDDYIEIDHVYMSGL